MTEANTEVTGEPQDPIEPAPDAGPETSEEHAPGDVGPAAEPTEDEIQRAQSRAQALRAIEALLFASTEPMDAKAIAKRLPAGTDVEALIDDLEAQYANRGINLVRVAGKFAFRTAPDLAPILQIETVVPRKLSRAAIETLAIIAYHQPVTRAEIEEIRGVALSRGTLDTLMEAGWIQPKGHRETPGHPATWVTTNAFLSHFGLNSIKDLPGIEDLKAAGLLDARAAVSAYSEQGKLGAEGGETDEDSDGSDDSAEMPEAEAPPEPAADAPDPQERAAE
ncbi:MAG TPA: SMC-Scp complex subunit ScpB [Alphaproteobacteria bacterium]